MPAIDLRRMLSSSRPADCVSERALPPAGRGAAVPAWVEPAIAAFLLTILNALKPLHVDDVIWWYFAKHLVEQPLAPFDFTIYWSQIATPAMDVMAPPVLPYWWAGAIRALGEEPWLWKLSLLPINLLLAFSIRSLAMRFAPEVHRPLLWLILLSPLVLPAENLMLDVPCQAFMLGGLALALRGAENRRLTPAALGAVLIGMATLTKWNGLTGIAVLAWAVLLFAPSRRWLWIIAVPIAMFVGWEVALASSAGESHFLHHLASEGRLRLERQVDLARPLLLLLAAAAPGLPVLALARGRHSRALAIGCAAIYLLMLFLLAAIPERPDGAAALVESALTLLLAGVFSAALLRVAAIEWSSVKQTLHGEVGRRRPLLFFVGWLSIEVAGYFAFSPFPAARRVIGLFITLAFALSFVIARAPEARRCAWIAAAVSVLFGFVYEIADTSAALTAKTEAHDARMWVDTHRTGGTVWFSGVHGFEYYATQEGMRPAVPGQVTLNRGDWLIISGDPTVPLSRQLLYTLDESRVRLALRRDYPHALPVKTYPSYYIGRRPLQHAAGPITTLWLYRVVAPFRPTFKD